MSDLHNGDNSSFYFNKKKIPLSNFNNYLGVIFSNANDRFYDNYENKRGEALRALYAARNLAHGVIGTPLGASISQCGSSGIPVYLRLQWSSSVVCPVVSQCTDRIWFGGHQVRSLPSMRPLMYATGMVRVVWAKLISFDLQPQIHKNYNGAHIKGMHRVMLKYSHVLRAELASIAEQ